MKARSASADLQISRTEPAADAAAPTAAANNGHTATAESMSVSTNGTTSKAATAPVGRPLSVPVAQFKPVQVDLADSMADDDLEDGLDCEACQ
jgi:hypothetical protein